MGLPKEVTSFLHIYEDVEEIVGHEDTYSATQDGKRQVIIKVKLQRDHEKAYDISKEGAAIYFVKGLHQFVHTQEKGYELHCFVYEKYETLKHWMKKGENVVMNNLFTSNFLQILRDAFRGIEYLCSSNRCHGTFSLSSIAVVTNSLGSCRGKLMDVAPNGTLRGDCDSAAKIIAEILNGFLGINKVQHLEMQYLQEFFTFFAQNHITMPERRSCWLAVLNYPVFLNGNMRNLVRLSQYTNLSYIAKPEVACNRTFFIVYEKNWESLIMDPDFKNIRRNPEHNSSIYGFAEFCRHSIVHLEERASKRVKSMKNIDNVLNNIWPGFITALFNEMHFCKLTILEEAGSLR